MEGFQVTGVSYPHLLWEHELTDLFPAVEDPNTGITLWESGAIIIYLIEQYDTTNSLSYGPDSPTHRHHCNQWLMFQLSGQGPYFGQLAWFVNFHPEKLPSVQERYSKELHRVLGVLETALQANGGGVLVGDKLTYADLAFVWWNEMTQIAAGTAVDPLEGFPGVLAWHKRMKDRDSFKKTAEVRTAAMKEQQLGATGLKQGQTVQDLEAEVAKQKQ